MEELERITYFGRTSARPPHRPFGIKQRDRLSHVHVIGKTGVGKTTLLETMLQQDVLAGRGFALLDPHGDLAGRVAAFAKRYAPNQLVYLNAPDPTQPYGYNPLRGVARDRIPLAAAGLLEAFKKRFASAWGVRLEHVLRNTLFALLEYGKATLADVPRIMTDEAFAKEVIASVQNESVRRFWEVEWLSLAKRSSGEALGPVLNKVGAFLADPVLRRLVTAPPIDVRLRPIMDQGRMLVVNLGRGSLGEDSASLLGALLTTTIALAAFSRADTDAAKRRPFMLYIDEFQTVTTESVAGMVSELRKYGVGLVLAHQHLAQLDPGIKHAVLGNVGTSIVLRLGAEDAPYYAREFAPLLTSTDIIHLPNYAMYVSLMIDGMPSDVFSATTISPEHDRGIIFQSLLDS